MKNSLYVVSLVCFIFIGCTSESITNEQTNNIVQYFEYPDHNVLEIGSSLTDLYVTDDSNTLIAADKGNNQVRFIDVSSDHMVITDNVWVGSEPTSLDMTSDGKFLLVGLRGASSVSVVSMETRTLVGTIALDEDGVFDTEYANLTGQLIVSYVSGNSGANLTKIYKWDDSQDNTCNSFGCDVECGDDDINCLIEYPFEISENIPLGQIHYKPYAGPIALSNDEQYLYILDRYNGPPFQVYKYNVMDQGFVDNNISSSAIANGPFILHDIEYVPEFGVVVAASGTDFVDGTVLDHAPVYNLDDLNHIGNLGVGSTPVAVAYDSVGKHIYLSPTNVDDNGMFIIEYNIETQLQCNYYQVAGILASHSLIVDPKGEFIYAAVDDLSDQDTDEPYNNSSFNIQKVKIIPEGTFPINDF